MSENCPNCGAPNGATHRFCSVCGATLNPPLTSSPTVPMETGAVVTPTPADAPASNVSYSVQRWEADPTVSEAAPAIVGEPEGYARFVPPPPSVQGGTVPMAPAGSISNAPIPPPFYTGGASTASPGAAADSGPGGVTRREGATYAPYVSDAVRHLEKPKSARSWLLPVVAGVGLLLLALMVAGGYMLLNGRNANPAPVVSSSTPPTSSTSSGACKDHSANASAEEQVREAIEFSNDEQIRSWRELNSDILKCRRTGVVLDENIQIVERLRSEKMYAVPVLKRFQILDVKIDGDTAVAHTIEEWTVTFYTKDGNRKVKSNGPDTLKETYYLVKQDGRWLINRLDFEQQNGSPVPDS